MTKGMTKKAFHIAPVSFLVKELPAKLKMSEKTVACLFKICKEIWGGCPYTTSIGHGLDTADFGVAVATTANTKPFLSKSTTIKGSEKSEVKVRVLSDQSKEVESTISGQSTSCLVTPLNEDSESKGQPDGSNLQVTTSKRSKLQLAVLKEELSLKREMLSKIIQADKVYQQAMIKFSTKMENLSHFVSNAFRLMSSL